MFIFYVILGCCFCVHFLCYFGLLFLCLFSMLFWVVVFLHVLFYLWTCVMLYGFEVGMNLLSCMDIFFQYDMAVMFLISMWHM